MKKPEKKDQINFLSKITHADKDLATVQARSMQIGYNQCYAEYEEWIIAKIQNYITMGEQTEKHLIDKKDRQSVVYGNIILRKLIEEIKPIIAARIGK